VTHQTLRDASNSEKDDQPLGERRHAAAEESTGREWGPNVARATDAEDFSFLRKP
jgi:hypothetical protein